MTSTASPMSESRTYSPGPVLTPDEVSCDWRTAGHVTRVLVSDWSAAAAEDVAAVQPERDHPPGRRLQRARREPHRLQAQPRAYHPRHQVQPSLDTDTSRNLDLDSRSLIYTPTSAVPPPCSSSRSPSYPTSAPRTPAGATQHPQPGTLAFSQTFHLI